MVTSQHCLISQRREAQTSADTGGCYRSGARTAADTGVFPLGCRSSLPSVQRLENFSVEHFQKPQAVLRSHWGSVWICRISQFSKHLWCRRKIE
ncbi:hypothetical protein ANANG_G00222280 [Anguilla anguilla]|uniref:Uncharacterized protein n=1 Tax=Anguilla anguilla TaxID=7936 RepID=A0A9D3LY41_ANGAN|nr:hypothetical protein ANANG_G00222280 [Anguilla anguilla]